MTDRRTLNRYVPWLALSLAMLLAALALQFASGSRAEPQHFSSLHQHNLLALPGSPYCPTSVFLSSDPIDPGPGTSLPFPSLWQWFCACQTGRLGKGEAGLKRINRSIVMIMPDEFRRAHRT